MKRIVNDVPLWTAFKHREARGLPSLESTDSKEMAFEDELFERLYTGDEQVRRLPAEQVDAQMGKWAQKVHEAAAATPNFKRLSEQTRGNAALAGVAVERMMAGLKDELDRAEQAKKAAKNDLDRSAAERAFGKAVAQAAERAAGVVEEVEDCANALGGVVSGYSDEDGEHTAQYEQNIRDLANNLGRARKIRELSKLVGRMRRMAAKKNHERVDAGADEVYGIMQGDDIARLLPTEVVRLMNAKTKLAFLRDYVEKTLIQYELKGKDTQCAGPMVVLLDKSGSMDGQKDLWATALAIALADCAQRDGRMFVMVPFDHRILKSYEVRRGDKVPADALMISADGGTDISMAVEHALNTIEKNPGEIRKADIVLVTDGDSSTRVAAALKQRATDLGVTTWGLGLGYGAGNLTPWCHNVHGIRSVHDLDAKLADQLFATPKEG